MSTFISPHQTTTMSTFTRSPLYDHSGTLNTDKFHRQSCLLVKKWWPKTGKPKSKSTFQSSHTSLHLIKHASSSFMIATGRLLQFFSIQQREALKYFAYGII